MSAGRILVRIVRAAQAAWQTAIASARGSAVAGPPAKPSAATGAELKHQPRISSSTAIGSARSDTSGSGGPSTSALALTGCDECGCVRGDEIGLCQKVSEMDGVAE